MDNPRGYVNEIRPDESLADCLQRQMRELGAQNYWEAVHIYAEREHANRQAREMSAVLFGFPLL